MIDLADMMADRMLEGTPEAVGKCIEDLEKQTEALTLALQDAAAFLRNDRFKTRVKNALSIIDEALAEVDAVEP
jgi:hypothetical protein